MSNKPLTITASILATPEKRELVRQSLLNLIPPTLKEEGCLNYDLHQDNENPDRFFFYENWESRQLWQNHNASAHIAAHRKATEGAVVEVIIHEMTHI
ncbi:Quinol monooxygenase YgiN [Pricia antarctica]|uniref:Quinol monooxygenase YgiN n=1 Tax=Pricia antarctica TaxID=641691 RepID=A0A1G6YBR8_9FLAO|nr:putative quinol monooxygenase [Pricia antarctica]SDD87045.1 Quinol monooxygenase YgiN [Pricia antarctica]